MTIDLGLDTPLVDTVHYKAGLLVATAVACSNDIVAFDGLPGTGKTTTVRQVANRVNRPVAIATMPYRPNPNDLLRYVYKGVTGLSPGNRDRYDLQNDTLTALQDWRGVLIIDELQNSTENALQELTWLYEESSHGVCPRSG